ncbi:BLUF domain-containing protein [Flocculibacter collagenilyticus]|uniref:BLUF domain-containing protein n=1 Tax=Flocculibacter collagenilyticus TaxID=2744479 RepID=UPI0018F32FD8|nr:BLUF domain-containing protein [Flocculibacter collagenilyticus]
MQLTHLIYCSATTEENISKEALEALLESSRQNNKKIDVTGILLFHKGSFFQVLEGDKEVINNLYNKISRDPRHTDIKKVVEEPIEERAFEKWSMAYPKVTTDDLRSIKGLNDFFLAGNSYLDLGEGRAKILLAAFKDGKWHPAN